MNAREFMLANQRYTDEMQKLAKNLPKSPQHNIGILGQRDGYNEAFVGECGELKMCLKIHTGDRETWTFRSPEDARAFANFILEMYPS